MLVVTFKTKFLVWSCEAPHLSFSWCFQTVATLKIRSFFIGAWLGHNSPDSEWRAQHWERHGSQWFQPDLYQLTASEQVYIPQSRSTLYTSQNSCLIYLGQVTFTASRRTMLTLLLACRDSWMHLDKTVQLKWMEVEQLCNSSVDSPSSLPHMLHINRYLRHVLVTLRTSNGTLRRMCSAWWKSFLTSIKKVVSKWDHGETWFNDGITITWMWCLVVARFDVQAQLQSSENVRLQQQEQGFPRYGELCSVGAKALLFTRIPWTTPDAFGRWHAWRVRRLRFISRSLPCSSLALLFCHWFLDER